MNKEYLFRVIFIQHDKTCELYARQVTESDMYGFIIAEELVFDEKPEDIAQGNSPLMTEFYGVTRVYIPLHVVSRIDEIEKKGIEELHNEKRGAGSTLKIIDNPSKLKE